MKNITDKQIEDAAIEAGINTHGNKPSEARVHYRIGFIEGANWREKQPNNDWIDERLHKPEFGVPVLVYCRIYGRFVATYEQILDTEFGNWHNGKELGILPPLYWMPLQELPNQ